MNNRKYVFSQLLDFLDRNDFNYLVESMVATSMSSNLPVTTSLLY